MYFKAPEKPVSWPWVKIFCQKWKCAHPLILDCKVCIVNNYGWKENVKNNLEMIIWLTEDLPPNLLFITAMHNVAYTANFWQNYTVV